MQMLFLQSAIDKMDDNLGRAAIIENGSPLSSGSVASVKPDPPLDAGKRSD